MFRNNNCDVEGAIEYLGALSSANTHGRDKSKTTDSAVTGNRLSNVDQDQAISCKIYSFFSLRYCLFSSSFYGFSLA